MHVHRDDSSRMIRIESREFLKITWRHSEYELNDKVVHVMYLRKVTETL